MDVVQWCRSFPEEFVFVAIANPGADLRAGMLLDTKFPHYYFLGAGNGILDFPVKAFGVQRSVQIPASSSDDSRNREEATVRLAELGGKHRTIGLHFTAADAIAENVSKAGLSSGPPSFDHGWSRTVKGSLSVTSIRWACTT